MSEKKGPASRGMLLLVGSVLAASVLGFQLLLFGDPEAGDDPLAGRIEELARQAAEAESADAEEVVVGEGGETFGDEGVSAFDYYVLALSWSPTFCARRPDNEQCGQGRRFILHGLWPNFETGYATDCDSLYDAPSAALIDEFADMTGGPRLLAYQWRKHGTCSGLEPRAYFEAARTAYAAVTIPPLLSDLDAERTLSSREIEQAFLRANAEFQRDGVTVRCRDGRFQEVRLCLSADLRPRLCGEDVARDCRSDRLTTPAPR